MSLSENEVIIKAIDKYKYKHNIQYADQNTPLFRRLRLFLLLSVIGFSVFNLFYILGSIVILNDADNKTQLNNYLNNLKPTLIPVCISVVLVLIGLVLTYLSKKHIGKLPLQIIGCLLIPAATIYNFATYLRAVLTVTYTGIVDYSYPFGLPLPGFFYWRNILPCLLILLFSIWMCVLYFRAKHLDRLVYENVLITMYERYQKGDKRGYTDEEWESFLQEYNDKGYQKQFDNEAEILD